MIMANIDAKQKMSLVDLNKSSMSKFTVSDHHVEYVHRKTSIYHVILSKILLKFIYQN